MQKSIFRCAVDAKKIRKNKKKSQILKMSLTREAFIRKFNTVADAQQALIHEIKARDFSVPDINEWPKFQKEWLLYPNKSHDQRFKLFCFLVLNGCLPDHAGYLCIWWAKNTEWEKLTDKMEMDVVTMVFDFKRGAGAEKRWRFFKNAHYDVYMRRVIPGMDYGEFQAVDTGWKS